MIYTLTLNPSVDYIVELEGFELGELNRTKREAKFPGGKGINVSRVLKEFKMNSKALGFNGGFTGKYIDEYLQKEGIDTDFVKVAEDSRINIKLKTGCETEINAKGPEISEENFETLMGKIMSLTNEDLLVLAGSIPSSLPKSTYEKVVKICSSNGVEFVCDAEGELLLNVLTYKPFLIKPNHHELADLFSVSISNGQEAIPYAKKLLEMGAKNVIVSLAGNGAVFVNKETAFIAGVPKGTVKNSVGAGDSMVAGFLAQYHKTKDLKNAFRFSIASGSATAFSLGLCTLEEVENLLPLVHIKDFA